MILIQNGRIMDPSQKIDLRGDLLIENGKISAIESSGKIKPNGHQTIDAKGKWVLPGFIDMHVHLREPGLEYKETIAEGTQAAIAGGFTSVACMANTLPVNDAPHITAYIREKAQRHSNCRVFIIGAVSKGLQGEELAEIGGMVQEGAVAISDDGYPVMNSYLMRKAMDYAKGFGIPVISHAEDLNLVGKGVMNEGPLSNILGLRGNPSAAEEILVAREIALCRLTGCAVHIAHLSTELGLRLIERAKQEGLPITTEVSPHHLVLTEKALTHYDTHCKMAPPLRTEKDTLALQKGLESGVIDAIATDHAPHAKIDKDVEFDQAAHGIIGLQTALSITYDLVKKKKLSASNWIQSLTSNPAQILNLPHGTLQKGRAADITIFDPDATWTYHKENNHSKSANSPFLGQDLSGKVCYTLIDGEIRYEG